MRLLGIVSLLGWVLAPGCWGLSCPKERHGYVGESLSVLCRYRPDLKMYSKFWCKGKLLCSVLVQSKSNGTGRNDRISIIDNTKNQSMEVIMNNLRMTDSGDYQCGVDDGVVIDTKCKIHVMVLPAPALDPEQKSTPSTAPESLQTTKHQEILWPIEPPDSTTKPPNSTTEPPDFTSEPLGSSGFTEGTNETSSSSTPIRSEESSPRLLIYCIILIFILLLLAAIILYAVSRKKRTGSCFPRKSKANLSVMASIHSTEEPNYENAVPNCSSDADGTGLYRIVVGRPENNYDFQEEVSYTTLLHSDLHQQAIYDNIDHLSHAVRQPPTEHIYAKVAKKHGN